MSKESIEQRAREMLAECARKIGQPEYAYHVGCGGDLDLEDQALIETLMIALTPQWQPIESAPKGQEVLVWRPDQGVFIAMIATPDMVMSESDIEECCLPEDFKEWYCEAWGWLEDDLRPTRWMPKPAEPEAV